NAWVTALPPLGSQAVEVDLGGAALPLAQFTDEGGEWVNWADGGRTLTWIWGPAYHRIALDRAWPPPADAKAEKDKKTKKDDKKKLPESQSFEITLTVPRDRPIGTTAYIGARVVTMKGDEVLESGTIVVTDDRIVAV